MTKCRAGVLTAMVMALAMWPAASKGADTGVCAPARKAANLNFTLKDVQGKNVALSAYKGQVIMLDFWATWCAPCKVEIPWFVELYKKYQSQGFVVLGVSVDDSVDKLKPFVAKFKMNYPVLIGDGRDDVKDAFGPLVGFPTSVLIARDGTICSTHIGYAPRERFEREVGALMALK